MEVILLENIENLGGLGDKVGVRPGYARNFLIPGGKAKYASKANIEEFEARRAELEAAAAKILATAKKRQKELEGLEVVIPANVGAEGKLFGSIGPGEIEEAVVQAGITLEKREIRMPEGAFRHAGEFEVDVHLYTNVDAIIKVIIEAEEE